MRKNSLTVQVSEHWNRLLREDVECPLLEILKNCLDTILCNVLSADSACTGRLGQMPPVQPHPFGEYVNFNSENIRQIPTTFYIYAQKSKSKLRRED